MLVFFFDPFYFMLCCFKPGVASDQVVALRVVVVAVFSDVLGDAVVSLFSSPFFSLCC